MRRRPVPKVYVPGVWQQLWETWRGTETRTVAFGSANDHNGWASKGLPLLVLRYPRSSAGRQAAARLEHSYRQLATVLQPSPLAVYAEMLPELPGTVVVLLQERNPGGCLGHARPAGMESAFTRQLADEMGSRVGEIDLSWALIGQWQPQPLASLALDAGTVDAAERREDKDLRYRVAMLAVLFHEMEHLAFPDRPEAEVRRRSDRFYEQVLAASMADRGQVYGMEASPSSFP